MKNLKLKDRFLNPAALQIIGVFVLILLAALLFWQGATNSSQATGAIAAQVYFEGDYRIADGEWQEIIEGEHIPSTQGDVTLRGRFHLLTPDGEYLGLYGGDALIAFYTDHISLTFHREGKEPYTIDHENPLFGDAACGVSWTAHGFYGLGESPLEIVVHNPHAFGNETAIDEMLENVAIWSGMEFEKELLARGDAQRNTGIFFLIVAFVFLGTALFSTLVHIKNSKILWELGCVILFASTYLIYSAEGVSLWNEWIVSNTSMLGISMMFYMLFLSMALLNFLKGTKKIGTIIVAILGVADALFLALPLFSDLFFYDMWLLWAAIQILANVILLCCLVKEFFGTKEKERWLYLGLFLPLLSFIVDVIMTDLGLWKGGIASKYIFMVFFIVAMVLLLRVIPNSINALAKAKELETERIVLNAQLAESRISTMMSQIRPHFIYNTLGSIEQLCNLDPQKAGELVHNFAKYLRGNFGELDNPKPIRMSREMEHVRYYVSIENVRFPDMTFSIAINTDSDFDLPALTIQPIVENAIKHGLMKLPKGGTIHVTAYETDTQYCVSVEDDGVGFDTNVLLDERKHVGIRNIRGRLKAMVNGTLEIESTIGVGTKVLITIPKEV